MATQQSFDNRSARQMSCLLLAVVLICPLLSGCQEESKWPRVPLTGNATLDGKPFSGGITFRPTRPVTGPTANTQVSEGGFKFTKRKGPVSGKHQAILLLESKGGIPSPFISTSVDIPPAEPFSITLEFSTPEDAAAPGKL